MISAGDWKLHRWPEDAEASEEYPTYDPPSGLEWVESFWSDPGLAVSVRKMVSRSSLVDTFRLPDHAIRKLAAREIDSGKFKLLARWIPTPAGVVSEGTQFIVPPPPEPRRAPAPSPPSEDDTFPPDADFVPLAAVLQEAARNGTPFCEECAKAAAAQQQQGN